MLPTFVYLGVECLGSSHMLYAEHAFSAVKVSCKCKVFSLQRLAAWPLQILIVSFKEGRWLKALLGFPGLKIYKSMHSGGGDNSRRTFIYHFISRL